MKEIYSFSVDLETKTTKEVEKTIVDKETGKEEKVKAEEDVKKKGVSRVIGAERILENKLISSSLAYLFINLNYRYIKRSRYYYQKSTYS